MKRGSSRPRLCNSGYKQSFLHHSLFYLSLEITATVTTKRQKESEENKTIKEGMREREKYLYNSVSNVAQHFHSTADEGRNEEMK